MWNLRANLVASLH